MAARKSIPTELLRNLLPLAILGIGVAGFAAIQSTRQTPEQKQSASAVPLVETVRAEANPDGMQIDVDGLVVPYREIDLAAEVAGRVAHKTADCEAGHFVTKGTLLFELDSRDYELEVKRLKLEVEQADSDLNELAIEASNAQELLKLLNEDVVLQQRQLERVTKIFQRQASSESTLDDARRAELAARNARQIQQNQVQTIKTRHAKLEQAKLWNSAKLEQAELNLSRARIVAPIDGVIVSEHVEQDDYVPAGTKLVTIDDTSAAEVKCNLRIDELRWVWEQNPAIQTGQKPSPGQRYHLPQLPVTVTYKMGDRRYIWRGVLSNYDGLGLDERTRTVPCRVLVSEPRAAIEETNPSASNTSAPVLLRGMYVSVAINIQPKQPLLRVPERAIRPGNVLWRVVDGKLLITPVKVAQLVRDVALIEPSTTGLQPDQQVIVSPLAVAVDGMAVEESKPVAEQVASQRQVEK
jgi:multidrug efflux pump subunit AcrA (membrane-fusion protein)